MSDFKFQCPNCQRMMVGDTTLLAEFLNCPDCSHLFQPTRLPEPKPIDAEPPPPKKTEAELLVTPELRLKLLREQTAYPSLRQFNKIVSWLFLISGMIYCLFSIINGYDARDNVKRNDTGAGEMLIGFIGAPFVFFIFLVLQESLNLFVDMADALLRKS